MLRVEKTMTEERGFNKYVWMIMLAVSIIFLIWTIFVITRGSEIFPTALDLAGSSQSTADIETKALKFIDMSMLKPLWEEIWIGIFGIFIAVGLKKKMKYAWTLGIFWGIMMIVNAVIQGGYELIILDWSNVCAQTYIFLVLGIIALVTLIVSRKAFTLTEQQQP
jgi:hypothetical protein